MSLAISRDASNLEWQRLCGRRVLEMLLVQSLAAVVPNCTFV